MNITIPEEHAKKLSPELQKTFGFDPDPERNRWNNDLDVDLAGYDKVTVAALRAALPTHGKGLRPARSAIKKFIEFLDGKRPVANSARQMSDLLRLEIATKFPGFTCVMAHDGNPFAYAFDAIRYSPERKDRDTYTPASVALTLSFAVYGKSETTSFHWNTGECRGKTAGSLLNDAGIFPESEERKEQREAETKLYFERQADIGGQYRIELHAYGIGSSWSGSDSGSSRYLPEARNGRLKNFAKSGGATVVVDQLDDDDEDSANQRELDVEIRASSFRFADLSDALENGPNKSDGEALEDSLDATDPDDDVERLLPIHPLVKVYDLDRHNWLCAHVKALTPYKFDTELSTKLVLDEETKELIGILSIERGEQFVDIVSGKSGGMSILLAGPPGTGKTLTAEVYAESTERALLRVSCSQLGIKADNVESALCDVFRRANRWGAIILLDEADVYIRARGLDLQANAIVGVFLRVLEYQETVLFLTTNLPESVDDAISSRCIARIDYNAPGPKELLRIWRVLVTVSGMEATPEAIAGIVEAFPAMTGRDAKNTLKLLQAGGDAVTLKNVMRVSKFHPSRAAWANPTT